METSEDRRTEQRLKYRWPVKFSRDGKDKSYPGQIVDVSSGGMAILCRSEVESPEHGQQVKADFGVPYFNSDSFDAVYYNRSGRVCRVDQLSDKVRLIAIQFAEPLFFKPGEQNISDEDAAERLKLKAVSIAKSEEKARIYGEALASVKEKIKSYAESKAEIQSKLVAAVEAKVAAEEKAGNEMKERAKAEAKAKSEAMLRAKIEKKFQMEKEQWDKLRTELEEKIKTYEQMLADVKIEAAQEIVRIKAEASQLMAKIRKEFNSKAKIEQSSEKGLWQKVEDFMRDRGTVF
jgi:ElaB/YqjD/DUF883 family membrane-anchored ribosome-binding protein